MTFYAPCINSFVCLLIYLHRDPGMPLYVPQELANDTSLGLQLGIGLVTFYVYMMVANGKCSEERSGNVLIHPRHLGTQL